jgi:hypothetical protein
LWHADSFTGFRITREERMSTPVRKLDPAAGQMNLQKLESELLRLPLVIRQHLAYALLDSVEADDAVEATIRRRSIEVEQGTADEVDAEDVIAGLRTRHEADVEAAWADEAHRRWEACLRGLHANWRKRSIGWYG